MYGSRCGEDFRSRNCQSPEVVRPCHRQGDVAAGTTPPDQAGAKQAKRTSARGPPPSSEVAFYALSKDSRRPDLSHPGDQPIFEQEDETLQRETQAPLEANTEDFERACLAAAAAAASSKLSNSSNSSSRERALLKRLQDLEHYVAELETRLVALVPEEVRSSAGHGSHQEMVPGGVLEASQRASVAWEAAEEFLADPSAHVPKEALDFEGNKGHCSAGTLAQAAVLWSSVDGGPLEVSALLVQLAKLAMGRASARAGLVGSPESSEDKVVLAADHPMIFDEAMNDSILGERSDPAQSQLGQTDGNIERMPPVAARCGSRCPEEGIEDGDDEGTSPKTSWLLVRASAANRGPRTVRAENASVGEGEAPGEAGGDSSPFFDDASAPVFSEAAPTFLMNGPRSIDQILAGSDGNPCLLGQLRRPSPWSPTPEERALLSRFKRNQLVIYHRIIRFILRCWKEEAQKQVHPSLRGLLPASLLKPKEATKGQGVLSRADMEKEKRVLQALRKHPPGFRVGSATLGAAASDISRTLSL